MIRPMTAKEMYGLLEADWLARALAITYRELSRDRKLIMRFLDRIPTMPVTRPVRDMVSVVGHTRVQSRIAEMGGQGVNPPISTSVSAAMGGMGLIRDSSARFTARSITELVDMATRSMAVVTAES
jgi:hypothetical protein